jgi:glycosyltransferase involved in cell wall biosynthesis
VPAAQLIKVFTYFFTYKTLFCSFNSISIFLPLTLINHVLYNNLTILIPTRNRPEFLDCAITSVVKSFGPETKVIIGDNGDFPTTKDLLENNKMYGLNILHLNNPAGSTYLYNLQRLINTCSTEWLSILHDDDFFMEECASIILPILNETSVDFIFSDHWVASHEGELLEQATKDNSIHYKRALLPPGKIENLAICAIEQRICLDGFFVRTALAKAVPFDLEGSMFGDSRWLIEICARADMGLYSNHRIFAYRLNENSTTAGGLNQNELLQALKQARLALKNSSEKKALNNRIYKQAKSALKYSVKNLKIAAMHKAVVTLLSLHNDVA